MDDNFDDIQEIETPEGVEQGYEEPESYYQPSGKAPNIRQTVSNAKNKITKAAGDTTSAAGKATDAAGKGLKAAGKGTELAGKGAEAAGKGMQSAGKGLSAAGDAAMQAGAAASSTGVGAIGGVPLAIAGAAGKAAGTGLDVAGKGTEAAGKGAEAAGKGMQESGDKISEAGKKMGQVGKNISSTAKTAKDAKEAPEKVKEAAKKTVEVAKKTVETLKDPVKRWILIGTVCLLLLIILVAAILEPLTDAMNKVKTGADYVEKLNNFIHGLGFENSKDAFYDELEFLSKHYDGAIDESTLMATLFYDDVFGTGNVEDSEYGLEGNEREALGTVMMGVIDYAAKEAFTEEDANGIVYSANKIYRLKKLTRHMAEKDGSSLVTVPLDDYIDLSEEQIASDGKAFGKSLVAAMCARLLLTLDLTNSLSTTLFGKVMSPYYSSTMEYLQTSGYATNHDGFDAITNSVYTFDTLFEDLVTTITDIEGISLAVTIYGHTYTFSFGETGEVYTNDTSEMVSLEESGESLGDDFSVQIMVTYSQYELDEDGYFEYLKEEYIPNMPEFQGIIRDKNNDVIDSKVDGIIDDIKMLSATWEEIYGDGDGTGESDVCIGNIHPNLLSQFTTPVALETGAEVNFSTTTAFGVTKNGKMHYGVDLNEDSVGVGVGTPVLAIYGGTIVESTTSGDFTDFNPGDGGCIKINHNMTYDNDEGESTSVVLDSYYCGLDPGSMASMTTGTSVTAGAQIGTIGDAAYSEDGKTPGLHFAIFSEGKGSYMNPINVFITCNSDYRPGGGYGDYDIVSTSCLKVHGVPITLEQFKMGTNYAADDYSILGTWDLDLVYNEAVANNINPELLVIRAISEGFSPYNKNHNNYNYWGLGCANNTGVCEHYSSMAAGIAGFASAQSVRNANSLEDMMSSYAYIGRNWYTRTEGADNYWSDGGCPYFPYIRKYMPMERQTEVARYCENPLYSCINDSTPTCFPTISVDQTAYTMYNIQDMNDNWDKYFGKFHDTESEDCDTQVESEPSGINPRPGKGTIFKVSESCGGAIRPDRDGYPSNILTERLDSYTDIRQYNTAIKESQGLCSSDGKRAEAVAVAVTTLNYAKTIGGRLPYVWAGGHGTTSDIGVKGNWKKGSYGLDCSGFVRWVLNTTYQEQRVGSTQAEAFDTIPGARRVTLSATEAVLKPGDLLVHGYSSDTGHVGIIVAVDDVNKIYITAEAVGKDYGIKYVERSFNESGYRGAALDVFYGEKSSY